MSKDSRIYVRCDEDFKREIDHAARVAGKTVGFLTRTFWIRFLEDQDGLNLNTVQSNELQGSLDCNLPSRQQHEQHS